VEGGGSDWHGTTSPNNDVGRRRERLLLGRATAGAARVLFCVRAFRRCRDEVSEGGSVGAKATSWGRKLPRPPHRTPLCPAPVNLFSFSFSIVPHDQPKFFAPLTASSIPVPLAIEEVARRPCLMPAADLVVRAAAATVLALSSDREMQPLECSGASRTSERGR